ncbi:monoheme cytochrome C [uncultured Maribacter sp.]|uniref:monoheme cytochrome C n=1 Tax=uncultured Maribacter sp. TaxID=431308 RepID=UPI0026055906|nr:monoheme cytochrome C [uncultured Maribacter sp.]
MDLKTFQNQVRSVYKLLLILFGLVVVTSFGAIYFVNNPDLLEKDVLKGSNNLIDIPLEANYDKIENGIHVRTGLVEDVGLMETVNNCTNCHSSKLVIQNRMNKERWVATIRWMQKTQNLWDLGKNEDVIIDYLVKNYPPEKKGRREVLTNVEWYMLKE